MPERSRGEALIQMRLCGICDTDLQLARGYLGFTGVLGHEFVGEVLEADTLDLVGKRVVADINAGCGSCEVCRERGSHHCPNRTVLGIVGRGGAVAEQLVIPEANLVEVNSSVSDEQAVFAEPLAAALHILDAVPDSLKSSSVAVLGDGKLGLLSAMALTAAGLRVMCIGHHSDKLALLPSNISRKLERDLTSERFAVVVEATGSASGLERAIQLTRPEGTLVLKTTVSGRLSVDLAPVVINELTLVGSRCGNMKDAVALLERRAIDPTPLIRARYPLSLALEALEHARMPGVLKVLVEGSKSPQ